MVPLKATRSIVSRNTTLAPVALTNALYSVREAPLLPLNEEASLLVSPPTIPTSQNIAPPIVGHGTFQVLPTLNLPYNRSKAKHQNNIRLNL